MPLAHIRLHLRLPGLRSLKAKRAALARLAASLRKLNYSFAETGRQDAWQDAQIELALLSSDGHFLESQISQLEAHLVSALPEVLLTRIEIERY